MKYIPILLLLMLTSCASINENETGAKLAITYATLKLIDQNPDKSAKVCEIAGDAQTYFDQETLPIIQIEQLIRRKIDFTKLDPADALLAETLIVLAVDKISEKTTEGIIDPETRVTGSKVLGWVKGVSC